MIPELRKKFNREFTPQKYQRFLKEIIGEYNHVPPFRLCETPIFIPAGLKNKLIEACRDIYEVIGQPDFKEKSEGAIKHPSLQVPDEDYHTRFLQMDFAVCKNEQGELHPQLIELQGFPSLYFFQDQIANSYKKIYNIPDNLTVHPEGQNREQYLSLLKEVIVGNFDPKQVVLMDIEPEKQNTYIDFLGASRHLGIKILCISDLKKKGDKLYYLDEKDKEVPVKRIYNRVIFDELNQRDDIEREFYFKDKVDVEWVGHPSWFFRISKYTLPSLKSPFVPESYFLSDLDEYPEPLSDYVLKPLYSFAGAGVNIDITADELDKIEEKEYYILQKKVEYSQVIETPGEPAKCEIRMMMIWDKDIDSGKIVTNLIRISKGAMSGVKFNFNKDWVGASIGFFEP